MTAGAQHGRNQHRADYGRCHARQHDHQEVRNARVRGQHGRGVGANAKECRAREVGHAGKPELDCQPQAGGGVKQHGTQHQQDEMALVKQRDQRQRAGQRP
ncbi:hypothetical protein D9M68_790910 [compost metagenome]